MYTMMELHSIFAVAVSGLQFLQVFQRHLAPIEFAFINSSQEM
jgi:hypothetical protein